MLQNAKVCILQNDFSLQAFKSQLQKPLMKCHCRGKVKDQNMFTLNFVQELCL